MVMEQAEQVATQASADQGAADRTWALKSLASRRAGYQLYGDYFDGKHRLTFATEKFRNTFGSIYYAFADNFCPAVVDATTDRLQILGFTVTDQDAETVTDEGEDVPAPDMPDTPTASDLARDQAMAIWNRNNMDDRAGEVHTEAVLMGDAYVLVWPDENGRAILWPQLAAEMTVRYDERSPNRVSMAAKLWHDDLERWRLNMYYPDRIEKYVSTGKSLPTKGETFGRFDATMRTAGGTDVAEPWPLPNPYGVVPVFHFATNARTNSFGRSDLKDVIPLQDMLNKSVLDMMVAMELHALPARWATGLEVPIDERTGQPKPVTVKPGDLLAVADKETKFGQFQTGELTQYLDVQREVKADIARVSRTPFHVLMLSPDQAPSGEALKTAESPFTAKVEDRQKSYGPDWAGAMALALRMESGPDVAFDVTWENAAPRSDRDQAEIAVIKRTLGVSGRQLLRELGYAEDEIDAMEEERARESAGVGETIMREFDRGAGLVQANNANGR